jgi:localization factor PodJL
MNARTSRSAKAGQGSNDNHDERAGTDPDLAFEDLLDARFDADGRLAQVGRGSRQRVAERLDTRPPAASAEELERAVRRLAEGLEAIERQSRPARQEARVPHSEVRDRAADAGAAAGDGSEFVTYSLDRLEARLEALSQRLQSRAAPQVRKSEPEAVGEGQDPSLAIGLADAGERAAERQRMAKAEAERERRAEEGRRKAEAEAQAETRRRSEQAAAEARRLAAEQAAEEARRADEAEAEARRLAEAMRAAEAQAAQAKKRAEADAAEVRRRAEAAAAEATRRAQAAEADARRHAEAAEAERLARLADQQREAAAAEELQRQFAAIEARLDALHRASEENRIAPVRQELIELIGEIEEISRDRGDVAAALEQIGARLGEMELKVQAARNMAGNRLGDIQDRLAGLSERLDEVEIEIPGFDAVRENQGAILERFDRMEGLVNRLSSPQELLGRIDGLRRQLDATASQQEAAEIRERILHLAERLDALPETLSDATVLVRIEEQLSTLASELTTAQQQRISTATDLDQRLSGLSSLLREVGESGRTPDLSGIEERLAEFARRLDESGSRNGQAFSGLEQRLAALATSIEEQEDDAAAEILSGLTHKIDQLAEAIEAQDTSGARRDIEALDGKLDQVAKQLAGHAEHLSRAQLQPLETRLDGMQTQLEQLAHLTQRAQEAKSDQFGPFAKTLQEIADRVSALDASDSRTPLARRLEAIEDRLAGMSHSRGPDTRALQTQLEGIVSRLELLKGRSIDPARLSELFERVDTAVRALPGDRFDRLERRLAEAAIPAERFDRLERTIAANNAEGLEQQIGRLERRLSESVAGGISEDQIDRLERHISESASGGMSEEQVGRLERRLAESAKELIGGHLPVDLSEERFARLERQLQQIGFAHSSSGDLLSPEDLSELRNDIVALRRELRSLPGLGAGEGHLGEILQTLADRMERLPQDPPATAAELSTQVERIAQLLEDPSHSRLALAHIETSLKTIEERLEDTRRSVVHRPAREDESSSGGEAEAVAGMARLLSDDVSELKGTAEASEKKTREALDAVQSTLEAVVKRMAFLERDSEAPAARTEPQVGARGKTAPFFEESVPEKPSAAESALDEAPSLAAEPEAEESRPGGGLLSRLTSRQLLKRATGGRAESFSPEPEEPEDETDIPLEPGTDAPLSSSLTGAPSSDTHFMSGGRGRSRTGAAPAESQRSAIAKPIAAEAAIDEDFLTAARRAARAAADEATDAEESSTERAGGLTGAIKSRRGMLMAAALAVAVAFAALQIIRTQMNPGESEVVSLPPRPASTSPATEVQPPAASAAITEPRQPLAPAASTPPPAEPAESEIAEGPAIDDGEAAASASQMSLEPPSVAESAPSTPEEVAALTPAEEDAQEAGTPPEETAAASSTASEPDVPELPVSIGSDRLRTAALAGDSAALFEVASRYAEGRGVLMDMHTAVAWYRRAAEGGLAPAQYRLGSIYEKGLGVPRNLTTAQDWYRQAAEAGNVKAMHNLAVLYAEGAGGEPDLEHASELFRQAAEHGVRDSQFNLAVLHARGLGVPRDLIEAYKWFSVAASSGDEESANRRDIIAQALSEDDLAKAKAAAASFEPLPLISEANDVIMPRGGWSDTQDSTSVEARPVADNVELGSNLSENERVALVQKLLSDQGFDPGPADGLLGSKTIQAIVEFQNQAGLPRTGQIDLELMKALNGSPG